MRVETIGEADARFVVHHGDNMSILPTLADCSVDAIVTDPPAGIAFMGKAWDSDKGGRDAWIAWLSEVMGQCLRVLKPGGHALVWAIPRTSHWTGMAIENAGFEIRDRIAHCFGSGFPKSLSVSKAIDAVVLTGSSSYSAMADVEDSKGVRLGKVDDSFIAYGGDESRQGKLRHGARREKSEAQTDAARQWKGWGTALKPAIEDWWLARKPLVGTVAANVLAHGTGALNIGRCRVETTDNLNGGAYAAERQDSDSPWAASGSLHKSTGAEFVQPAGRWPANLIHSGEPEVLAAFPVMDGKATGLREGIRGGHTFGGDKGQNDTLEGRWYGDTGSAARFFMQCPPDEATRLVYTPKASRSDRDKGNTHSTVKPIALMRYLCRLITPPDGVVLDPFAGSGSSGQAAMFEGFRFIGIEQDAEHVDLARHRVGLAARNGWQPGLDLGRVA